jgi:hypothetical protein
MRTNRTRKWTIVLAVAILFAQLGAPFGLQASETVDGRTIIICTGAGFKTIQVDEFGEETSPEQGTHISHCCVFCPSPCTAHAPTAEMAASMYDPSESATDISWPAAEPGDISPQISLSWSSRAPPHAS